MYMILASLTVNSTIIDHRATYVYIDYNSDANTAYKCKVWNYKEADSELLNKLIQQCD